ncbi:unnamed protein product [Larinioides sclopetarius]|uniref:Uncharacterized protein n=1 Tax=Larinioides sclopetarius TaxID=280406 RepID=A0AAV2ABU2_9ARAC
MTLLVRIFCFSAAVMVATEGAYLFKSAFVTECTKYEFRCDDGGCVDAALWCNSHTECSDESDEKYCKKIGIFSNNKDPNRCPSTYFKCNNGPCIPYTGRCDGYENCEDSSDENNCWRVSSIVSDSEDLYSQVYESTTWNYDTSGTTVLPPEDRTEESNEKLFFASLNASQNYVRVNHFTGLHFSDFSEERNKARNWILYQRKGDYGWGDETPRSITALCLSAQQPIIRNTESDLLMIKQLEIQLLLELIRNGTKPMKLTDLALYINALLACCRNPKNFYGDNMVAILREGVNAAQKEGAFVNPSIYLTLCINNATDYDDIEKLRDIFLNWNATVSKLHIQSLVLLTTACIFRKTNILNSSLYDSIQMEFLHNVIAHGFPGNIYEAALLFQALQEMKITLAGLPDFILRQQQADGSFGDILSTYLVLPILAGRNLVQMIDYCGQQSTPDLIPLEVLKNVKSKKMHVQYSLNYGVPPEVTQTLQMHVAKGANFLDVMRLAQEINSKYRFKLNAHREIPIVYSIGDMPNDVEKGMYWILYKASGNSTEIASEEKWVSYDGGSPRCSEYELPCENGECVADEFWCNSLNDCSDGSDEKYCQKSIWFDPDPNRCPSTYFRCSNGPCIPLVGRCNGYPDCEDSSDEENCIALYTTTKATVFSPTTKSEVSSALRFFDSLNSSQNSMQMKEFSGLHPHSFSEQRNKARNWLLSQRSEDYGWEDETPRAITALYLLDGYALLTKSEKDLLMVKQLKIEFFLKLMRNGTKSLRLPDFALYLNALHVICKNPKNFYGNNLVRELRDSVNDAQKLDEFVNPSVFLTLCISNATIFEDIQKLQDIFLNKNETFGMLDIQALALLTTACIFRKTDFLNELMYDNLKMAFLRNVKVYGFPGNIYEAALLFQALQEMEVTLEGLMDFILACQQEDGSFGDILSTYLVLPILAGKNMISSNDHCGPGNTSDLIPMEVLKNTKNKKMLIHYTLNYGFPPEIKQTIQIHVAEGSNFLDIMRLAQEINPKYRFRLSENREFPVVYSIGDIPNDAEKGMYWALYKASRNRNETTKEKHCNESVDAAHGHWVSYIGDVKQLILTNGDKVLFWYRPL